MYTAESKKKFYVDNICHECGIITKNLTIKLLIFVIYWFIITGCARFYCGVPN